ncbi:hypothetical protein KQI42_19985 [Tissierella sp. MSJ-40]|uniref:DZANK-type domain-containing protein n=1 Tax=Tissierella simiarum TaxID=2841534 RepID=A0ABS6EBH7_9FIRM|nr:hypothetical protein [Tissierella simiarum]MBU5440278.1 hypothetical protein [Tissierella simiarum]
MNYCLICGLPLGQKKKCPRCEERKQSNGECSYCAKIYNSTPKSPRRKYKHCPMCGEKLNKGKFKDWRVG